MLSRGVERRLWGGTGTGTDSAGDVDGDGDGGGGGGGQRLAVCSWVGGQDRSIYRSQEGTEKGVEGKGRLVSRRKEGKDAKEIVKDVRRKARR